LDRLPDGVLAFHAGTALSASQLVTSGGRVLGIAASADTLPAALSLAYQGVEKVHFEGMQYRRDIGSSTSRYASSGVSIATGNRAVELMRQAVRATFTPAVLSDVGAYGGLYSLAALKDMDDPILVASTDGVGTKVALAARAGRYAGIGRDIVNHCINDILVQGARPLFFLDYYAAGQLEPERVAEIVAGMSAACQEAGCALLGGETAEMPGVYATGHFDVAGTIVGVVERSQILPRPGIQPGDVLIGLASSGPHTNGYSLIRNIFDQVPLETIYPELGGPPLVDTLLAPHRSYFPILSPLLTHNPKSTTLNPKP
jgi:phosphoribosylaminoimidazole synthetase